MPLCIFEDNAVDNLEPITLTRPAFDLWCGASTLLEKQRRWAGAEEVGVLIRPELVDFTRFHHPQLAFNDSFFQANVFVNARYWPTGSFEPGGPRVGVIGDEIAYVVAEDGPEDYPAGLYDWLDRCRNTLPWVTAQGRMIRYLWDLVDGNAEALCRDAALFGQASKLRETDVQVLGKREELLVAGGAEIEPYVVADTRKGPVMIDAGAIVHSFTRLEGPCYVGKETWLLAPKLRGGTIGPGCRVGGEFEASILLGHSNKYHDGFLGHSYVGEWVNLAAGTQTSDLRNDYGTVQVFVNGQRTPTGKTKVGSFIGDHTKTGLGALFNTGTSIGVFCNILPSGFMAPPVVPSFVQVHHGQLQDRSDLKLLFQTAATAMGRRGCTLTEAHREFFFQLYEKTAKPRSRAMQDVELRRLKRSV